MYKKVRKWQSKAQCFLKLLTKEGLFNSSIMPPGYSSIFKHAHSVPHFALNFLSVLFLKAIVSSQRIFSLSKRLKISKQGRLYLTTRERYDILQYM